MSLSKQEEKERIMSTVSWGWKKEEKRKSSKPENGLRKNGMTLSRGKKSFNYVLKD